MKRGLEFEVTVHELGADGLGRATLPGERREVRVENGLPGERGRFRVQHVGNRIHGHLVAIDPATRSAERRETLPCPRWTPDSPCRLMHLTPSAQRGAKAARVRAAFANAGMEVQVRETVPEIDVLRYRSRVLLATTMREDGEIVLGAYRRNSHHIQPMVECLLPEPALDHVIRSLGPCLRAAGIPVDRDRPIVDDEKCGWPFGGSGRPDTTAPAPGSGSFLRHVALRCNEVGAVEIALLASGTALSHTDEFATAIRAAHPEIVGVHLGRAGAGDAVFGPEPLRPIGDSAPLIITFGGLEFEVSPRAFFQIHREAAARLHEEIFTRIEGPTVIDLYCGVGVLSVRLAARGMNVLGIERVEAAVEDARRNAARNRVGSRVEFQCADATEIPAHQRWSSIVMNPPRRGCDARVLEAVSQRTNRLVYVSCNPDTLARDALVLAGHGLRLIDAVPVDLFPESEHVETVALFRR